MKLGDIHSCLVWMFSVCSVRGKDEKQWGSSVALFLTVLEFRAPAMAQGGFHPAGPESGGPQSL